MRFPTIFTRSKGGGAYPVLGSDTVPTVAPSPAMDNLLITRFNNVNGWPVHRVAVAYQPPSGVVGLRGTMYIWIDQLETWFRIDTANKVLGPNAITFFDTVALLDQPNTTSLLDFPTTGSIAQLLIVSDPGGAAPNGDHNFAVGSDLTPNGL